MGDEICVDYGSSYFEEETDGCPCLTCKPPIANADPDKDPEIHTRQLLDLNARQIANRTKRARQAKNRKKKPNGG